MSLLWMYLIGISSRVYGFILCMHQWVCSTYIMYHCIYFTCTPEHMPILTIFKYFLWSLSICVYSAFMCISSLSLFCVWYFHFLIFCLYLCVCLCVSYLYLLFSRILYVCIFCGLVLVCVCFLMGVVQSLVLFIALGLVNLCKV